jgi:hypothetical protein
MQHRKYTLALVGTPTTGSMHYNVAKLNFPRFVFSLNLASIRPYPLSPTGALPYRFMALG